MALAVAAAFGATGTPALALGLGRISVLSALGEPLRAEIEVVDVSADEATTLRASIAESNAFQAAGVEFNQALVGATVNLERRPDGRYMLRLAGQRVVTDPFVDLLVDATWSGGRVRRDFTLLLDPPALRQAPAPAPVTAQAAPPAPPPAAAPAPGAVRPAPAPAPASAPAAPAQAARAPAAQPQGQARTPAAPGTTIQVRAGDTAGRIAGANKPPAVSLDQMLVALLRSNPEAFAGGNINRLRAGSVLNLPTQDQIEAVSAAEARQSLVAQSRDFNDYRRRLAEGVTGTAASGSGRQVRGTVEAKVDDKRPAASQPDRLKLSKGSLQARGPEDAIARQRAAQDSASRAAELSRNMAQLQGLAASAPKTAPSAAAAPAAPASRPAASAGPAITAPVVAPTPTPAPAASAASAAAAAASRPVAAPAAAAASAPAPTAAVAAAPAASAASASAAAASAPASAASGPASAPVAEPAATPAPAPAPAPQRPTAPPPPPPPEPSLVDELLDNPVLPAAGGGILALLAGLAIWKVRQRRKSVAVDSSFLESRLQPDSFFGASGGQRVDTAEGPATGSSLVYSPSQLDAAGDVDPVAEADVYLAYGRDLQAEEILKEALRINPQRAAIHVKLLEIYAKRRDGRAFEQAAREAMAVTQGEGSEWERICEMGQELDPDNPLYRPGSASAATMPLQAQATMPVQAMASASEGPVSTIDLDLDLDFSADAAVTTPMMAFPAAEESAPTAAQPLAADLRFDATMPVPTRASAPAPLAPEPRASRPMPLPESAQLQVPELVLPENSLNFDMPAPAATPAPQPAASAPAPLDPGMLEFDLGGLSLDLDPAPAPAPALDAMPQASMTDLSLDEPDTARDDDDPLATKLALAQEFNAIGDADGARSLAEEVLAEASGELRTRAQKFLAEIG